MADAKTSTTLRILAVDDVSINLTIARHIVSAMGHAVDTASSGQEAVEAATSNDYDMILMDAFMPGMDGLAATKAILSQKPNQVIVSVTAEDDDDHLKELLACGQKGCLIKPLTVNNLQSAIDQYLT